MANLFSSVTRNSSFALLVAAALMFATSAFAQNTTSSIRVMVTDESGSIVGNVPVTITHGPTGRMQTLSANEAGVVTARGLAVGGPYQVGVAAGGDYSAQPIGEIFIELDRTELIDLTVKAAIEEITVVATQTTQELRVGVGRDFDRAAIDGTPSLHRDFVSTLATDPKILVDPSVGRGPAVSMAGQNFRFNSVTIDGVAQNDNFGLSKNASATQRTPISIDAIEAINVNIAPYDVSYGNFVGGNINIVTKSGTNEFTGTAYAFGTSDSLSGDTSDGEDLALGDFSEEYYGFTFGGPIVKDKLFFFVNYEKFETDRPSNTQTIDNIDGVEQADIDRAISIFQTEYGFDPGRFATTDTDQDEKVLVKLDWHINDDHRIAATYQSADGDTLFDDFPELAALQTNRYNINEKLTAMSVHLYSNWTDNFSTELKIGTKDVENRQISALNPGDTPDFAITAPGGGQIAAGNDRFRHLNELDNESDIFRLRADWQLGNHLLTGGYEREKYSVRNIFLPFSRGQYVFGSLDNLENRVVDFVLYGNANDNGIPETADAVFSLAVDSFYIQDEWTPTDNLTLKFGVRLDTYSNSDDIVENTNFEARQGFSNQENLDGKDLVLPRFGFDWAPTDRLTVRGGVGLFGGGTPLILLSNSYAGDGISRTFAAFLAPFFGPPVSDSIATAVAALPDPDAAFDNFQQYIGTDPAGQTDVISPNYEILSTWKYSLGAEYALFDEWLLSADVIFSQVNDGYDIYEGTRTQIDSAPDGRPIYDLPPTGGDYIVENTSEGTGTVVTLALQKSFDTSWGLWDLNAGYTWQDVDELRSYNRFVTFETYAMDPQTDLNNGSVAPSRYEVENRVTATLTWNKQIFGDNNSMIGMTYAGRSGRHFSHVFGSNGVPSYGGHFLADFGSEADNPGSQLFYVPTSATDPLVTGDAAFLADLDQYISGESCLNSHRGSIVPRNNCETDWVNLFSVRFQQEVSFVGDTKLDLILDIENFGNLVNSDWGRIDSYAAPSNLAPANVAIVTTGTTSAYSLTPTASYDGTPGSVVSQPTIARISSAYRIQFGIRFRF